MTSRDFCFWLQGYLEISKAHSANPATLTPAQVECVQRHLALVFVHEIDPSAGPAEHQAKLDEVHTPQPTHPTSGGFVGGGSPFPGGMMRC